MRIDIKREILEYFKNKTNRTPQENRFLLYMQTEIDSFDITGVSRDDVDELGYDGANMTDAQMEYLATKMSDSYCDNGFWEDMKFQIDNMRISRLNEK